MLYVIAAFTALLLATGQSLWKKAAGGFSSFSMSSLLPSLAKIFLSPYFLIGAVLYVTATAIYVWLFSKYSFSAVQISLVSFSIIFTLFISNLFFKEHLELINYIGVPILLIGVLLITWRG